MLKLVRCALAIEDCQMIASRVASCTTGITVYRMCENSPEMRRRCAYRGHEYDVLLPGAIMEIVTDDSWADEVIARIIEANKDCLIGGRAIQVLPVEESYRIRDGFMDMR